MTQNDTWGLVIEQIIWHDLTNGKENMRFGSRKIWSVHMAGLLKKNQQDTSRIQLHETLKIYNCGLAS
jgi:hypothetical protein